jgi:hypothetical protein
LDWATTTQKQRRHYEAQAVVRMLVSQIGNAIENDQSFYLTANDPANPNLACYVTTGTCAPWSGPIQLNVAGTPGAFVGLNANSGFGLDGKPCNTFDATNGNDACPFRFIVTVTINCSAGCSTSVSMPNRPVSILPTPNIDIQLVYKPKNREDLGELYPELYRLGFDRGKNKSTTQNYCSAVGGVYNASSKFCSLLSAGGACSFVGGYMTGLTNSSSGSSLVCNQKTMNFNGACAPRSAYVGFVGGGQFLCNKY